MREVWIYVASMPFLIAGWYGMALWGEPSALWWWRDVLGVLP